MSAGCSHPKGGMSPSDVDKVCTCPEVKAELAKPKTIDEDYDLPYLAGYSKDGSTIYIDRHLPDTVKIGRNQVNPRAFLKLHEEIEKALIDALNYKYPAAHEVASRVEDRAVVKAGLNRQEYNNALKPFIKADEQEKLERVPADLDLAPYDGETGLLKRMREAMA